MKQPVILASITIFLVIISAYSTYAGFNQEYLTNPNLVFSNSFWESGGSKRGVGGYNSGDWNWEHELIIPEYKKMRVWGPQSGNTYGSDAWTQTTYDYNDDKDHVINFKWSSSINAYHIDLFAIQVTDGTIPINNEIFWPIQDITSLYVTMNDYEGEPCANPDGMQNTKPTWWSIRIDKDTQTAALINLESENAADSIICEQKLNPNEPWYIRFVIMDGTSSGFPAGDNSFYLHKYFHIV